MKAKNLNNSSRKTNRLIKNVFAEMLSEYKEISRISVSELCARAEISRGTFYSHYDDIYGVAEDYENELIDHFFDNAKLLTPTNVEQFIDIFFQYIRENDQNYKLLCRSNEFIFTAKKLTTIATNKFLELCHHNALVKNKEYIDLDIAVFIDGILCEYVKYCRGLSAVKLDDLYAFTKQWLKDFAKRRLSPPKEK